MENAIMAITLGQPDQMKCAPEQAAIAFAHAYAWLDRGKDLNLLTLYERRLQRAFIEDFKLLEMIQAQRHQRELAEARTPTRLAPQSRETAPPPEEPEFVFSNRPPAAPVAVPSPPGIAA
jgi:hypothetical protein